MVGRPTTHSPITSNACARTQGQASGRLSGCRTHAQHPQRRPRRTHLEHRLEARSARRLLLLVLLARLPVGPACAGRRRGWGAAAVSPPARVSGVCVRVSHTPLPQPQRAPLWRARQLCKHAAPKIQRELFACTMGERSLLECTHTRVHPCRARPQSHAPCCSPRNTRTIGDGVHQARAIRQQRAKVLSIADGIAEGGARGLPLGCGLVGERDAVLLGHALKRLHRGRGGGGRGWRARGVVHGPAARLGAAPPPAARALLWAPPPR